MKIWQSYRTAQRFKNIFGVNMGEFLDREMLLLDNGNVHLDAIRVERGLLIGKEWYDPETMSIQEGLAVIYGQHAADLVESLL